MFELSSCAGNLKLMFYRVLVSDGHLIFIVNSSVGIIDKRRVSRETK